MIKNIKVKINTKNKYELIILESANKNDIIDLKKCEINWTEMIESDNIKDIKQKHQQEILQLKNEHQEKENDLISKQNNYKEQISKKEQEIFQLKRERSGFNIKLLGEALETWCDNEVQNIILNLNNVKWSKDNEIINGAKGDFIYKLYLNENKIEKEILTSVMLEMKTEIKDKDANKKQKNETHFKKLDTDRKNKNLEFAVLISELEWDKESDLPIKKVTEYDKMYIVRPPYLITFLSIINSLAEKHKKIIMQKNKEKITFENQQKILDDFEEMKNDILDKSLIKIKNNLSIIESENEKILKASETISNNCGKIKNNIDTILKTHFQTVINKIKNFKITKTTKQIENHKNIN